MHIEIEQMDIDLYREMKELHKSAEARLQVVAEFENVIDFQMKKPDVQAPANEEFVPSSKVIALCAFGEDDVKVFPNSIVLKNSSLQKPGEVLPKAGAHVYFKIEEHGDHFFLFLEDLILRGSQDALKSFRYEPFSLDVFQIPFTALEELYQKYANPGSFKSLEQSSKFSPFEYQHNITDTSFQEDQHFLNFEYGFSKLLNEKRREILKALYFGEIHQIADSCTKIIGLGNGLTPSGDDYICGLFGVLLANKSIHDRYLRLYSKILQHAATLTNEISFSYLCELGESKYKPDFISFLKQFNAASASVEALEGAFLKLIAIGHFSGTDIVTGMMDAIAFLRGYRTDRIDLSGIL